MKTLAGIAHGYAENLVARAADCALKERRKLVIVPRETPLNLIHIHNMAAVTEAGAVVMPASPAFWHRPETVDDLVDSLVERIMVHLGALEKPSIEWPGD
jgi:4-hydroxy-3-polyprenylbenzoate decarboxylase